MISTNLHQIKKVQFQLKNNATLDEAEKSKQFKIFAVEVKRVIKKQANLISKDQSLVDQILNILSKVEISREALTKLTSVFTPFIQLVKNALFFTFLRWSGNQGGQSALIRLDSDKEFNLKNNDIINALEQRGLDASKAYDLTTKKQIISVITQGREMQLTNFEISELIREKFVGISSTRADIIAFNELANAVNLVEFETFKRNNVQRLRWTTVMDERVCPICEPLDGKIVATGSDFVGVENDKIMFEGSRPPAHVNCRCFLEEVIEGFGIKNREVLWVGQ